MRHLGTGVLAVLLAIAAWFFFLRRPLVTARAAPAPGGLVAPKGGASDWVPVVTGGIGFARDIFDRASSAWSKAPSPDLTTADV